MPRGWSFAQVAEETARLLLGRAATEALHDRTPKAEFSGQLGAANKRRPLSHL